MREVRPGHRERGGAVKETQSERILAVLGDGRWHGGAEFLDGRHGFMCSSYSQRIGGLMREGHVIERDRRGGDYKLGRYRLVRTADQAIPHQGAPEAARGAEVAFWG